MVGGKYRIKDIAIKAGVSVGTVDRVLHNRGEVKKETRKKILQIVKELDYKPNIAAQLLKTTHIYRIAIMIPEPRNNRSFWSIHPRGFEQAEVDANLYQTELKYFKFSIHDEKDFELKTREVLDFKPNGVILAPLFKNEAMAFCHQLEESNIPYIFIDTNIPDSECLAFVGEDAFKSGRVAANLIDMITPVEKDILIVNIAKDLGNTQHLKMRNQGFMSYFMENGRNKGLKISVDIPEDDPEVVKTNMDKVLQSNPNIEAILVSSSRTFAVAEYLERNKIKKNVVGYEAIEDNIEYLKKGIVDFIVSQRPLEQTKKTYDLLLSHITTHAKPGTKENIQLVDILNAENIS